MYQYLLLLVGVVGFSAAAWLDLKTTEFPDWLPYSIIISALIIRGGAAYILNDFSILYSSIMVGLIFLALGLLLYYTKQWGDGDAWLLGALGFLFPNASGFDVAVLFIFPLTLLTNFLVVSIIYLVVYSLYLGIRNPKIFKTLKKEIGKRSKETYSLIIFFFVFSWGSVIFFYFRYGVPFSNSMTLIMLPFLVTGILLFVKYARIIERDLFKKKIDVSKLKEGDVILDDKWRGVTKKEIAMLRKQKKQVWIKEGVRFAPVFVFTLLISLYYGAILLLFMI